MTCLNRCALEWLAGSTAHYAAGSGLNAGLPCQPQSKCECPAIVILTGSNRATVNRACKTPAPGISMRHSAASCAARQARRIFSIRALSSTQSPKAFEASE